VEQESLAVLLDLANTGSIYSHAYSSRMERKGISLPLEIREIVAALTCAATIESQLEKRISRSDVSAILSAMSLCIAVGYSWAKGEPFPSKDELQGIELLLRTEAGAQSPDPTPKDTSNGNTKQP
jgi:hypothetical protein